MTAADHAALAERLEDRAEGRLRQVRERSMQPSARTALVVEALAYAQLATSHRTAEATEWRTRNTGAIEGEIDHLRVMLDERLP